MRQPHIIITFPDDFPDELVERMTGELKSDKLNLDVKRIPRTPFASFEWAIPGVIAVFITQSYFSGFFSEMGKDHYEIFKKWLKENAISSRLIKVRTLTATTSPDKKPISNSQSKAFSIHIETADKRRIKFLFDLDLENSKWEKAIEEMMALALDNSHNYPSDNLSKRISHLSTSAKDIFAIVNPSTENWEFLDTEKMIEKIKRLG